MLVIPAIDIRKGRAVRLVQGDASRRLDYGDDPVAWAGRWVASGAPWLHVVDLDGAFAGRPVHLDLLQEICRLGARVQTGGGFRTMDDIEAAFAAGAARVVVGTAAVRLAPRLAALGERVAVSIDVRQGKVALRGWRRQTDTDAAALAAHLRARGIRRFVYTEIARDGALSGPDVEALRRFVSTAGAPVIAAGGVASEEDLEAVARTGVEGVIVGRALYEERIHLDRALGRWGVPAC
ncbi:MAG: 1-(5-phosphoribosyl)-5-[(5-phosphoribosylamino)methylideneamino]imidazole-4-carboxamide isomerase [Armatimonadota bacterium]|nr:1-(5-phosphoribosyl)-5-[(5-phosphoribosylamino)methylideneamino]imidazole-4-carboxamide isomerase [Armatimonadota bacterium]MDR7450653.1 1-(5-phosphoribosyl)-5-[(5-phosphoribosylamino)methylideneamino]imidazole-4-carboxamide isomerase [Armatimonadota bacterium]MDR7466214.1 1-(5-phosphoribosyl)-5-[(5-phosphoribosylamino)methylideneamino]imidazole-4-carboxamide isomerase [Armatimonadota bacterium]MDR7492935.1 1-(5-phosphoribosyl)-5-[(5-phosphoribosylamino)methylideneamino]imidazole-4-carboxamid